MRQHFFDPTTDRLTSPHHWINCLNRRCTEANRVRRKMVRGRNTQHKIETFQGVEFFRGISLDSSITCGQNDRWTSWLRTLLTRSGGQYRWKAKSFQALHSLPHKSLHSSTAVSCRYTKDMELMLRILPQCNFCVASAEKCVAHSKYERPPTGEHAHLNVKLHCSVPKADIRHQFHVRL